MILLDRRRGQRQHDRHARPRRSHAHRRASSSRPPCAPSSSTWNTPPSTAAWRKSSPIALGGACYNLPELRADTLLSTVKREIDELSTRRDAVIHQPKSVGDHESTHAPQRPPPVESKAPGKTCSSRHKQHARNYNDQAIPLYDKVLNGLMALPEKRGQSGNGRLHNLMIGRRAWTCKAITTCATAIDESLAVVEKLKTWPPKTNRICWTH